MARYRCPGCGQSYDGRKCRSCLYETFTEEVAHRNHYHAGEPLVLSSIPRQPSGKPGSCQRYGEKRKRVTLPKWLTALLAVVLLNGISLVMEVVEELDFGQVSYESSYAEPESLPNHLTIPEDAVVLYEADGILVAAEWTPGAPLTGEIPILVRNDTDRQLQVSSRFVSVDGLMSDDSFLYCDAYAGSVSRGWLYLDPDALGRLGIKEPAGVTVILDLYDAESYDYFGESDAFTLGEAGVVLEPDYSGVPLFDGDFRLFYQGAEWTDYGSLILEFYGENCAAGDILYLSSSELLLNGKGSHVYLYQTFLPQTRAVIRAEIYDPQLCGIEAPEDLGSLEFSLDASFEGESFTQYTTDPILVEVN